LHKKTVQEKLEIQWKEAVYTDWNKLYRIMWQD